MLAGSKIHDFFSAKKAVDACREVVSAVRWMRYDNTDKSQKDQMDTQNDNFSLVSTQTQEAHLGHKTPKFANCELRAKAKEIVLENKID